MDEVIHANDRVLETKIEGLSKLTDERFATNKETLTRLEVKIDSITQAGYITKAEHDKIQKEVSDRILAVETKNDANSMKIWIATGVVGTISFFSPLIFHFVFKI